MLFVCTLMLLPTMASAQCPDNNHPHMIDLGLPSGTKWACCNVGASKPEDYGGHYAWGETEVKDYYDWSTYIHCDGSENTCHDIGNDIAGTQYDAATANWGSPWVMPSLEHIFELLDNCTSEWTTENGVNGRRYTSFNGASIFLPAAGNRWNDRAGHPGEWGCYWSSLPYGNGDCAYELGFDSDTETWNCVSDYFHGYSVRPIVAGSSSPSGIIGISIDANTFPDDNFRNWVLEQDYGKDGLLTENEIAGVTSINVGFRNISDLTGIEYFTALEWLSCYGNQLTSLDLSQNTALILLNCYSNQLTSLNVSRNTALDGLLCEDNQLTSLDISKNTALEVLWCYYNQLTTLDVSKNTALIDISCSSNQLTSLDVSKNTVLESLNCGNNQLTSLDVSKNTALITLYCYDNLIKGPSMDALISGLSETGGDFYPIRPDDTYEQNVVTKAQVATAKKKGWTTYYWNSESKKWLEYEGSDELSISPVDEGEVIDIGTDIDENTNLDGNVVDNVYFNINDGSYDASGGCIVVNSPTDDSFINGQDIFGEDFKEGYNGIVFMVPAGEGTINVEAETTGDMVLKVKIGNKKPITMVLNGKLTISFPYDVTEDTYVYIYGGTSSAGAKGMSRAAGSGSLKIYGIEVTSGENGIESIESSMFNVQSSKVYNLNGQRVISAPSGRPGGVPTKGVFIRNGKKVLVK